MVLFVIHIIAPQQVAQFVNAVLRHINFLSLRGLTMIPLSRYPPPLNLFNVLTIKVSAYGQGFPYRTLNFEH